MTYDTRHMTHVTCHMKLVRRKEKKVLLAVGVMLLVAGAVFSQGLDWIRIHDQADETDLAAARETVLKNPGFLPDLYLLGIIYLNRHEISQARDVFQQILDIDPDSREGLWGMAEVMRCEHNYTQSRPILEQLIEIFPEYAPAMISLAYIKYIKMDFAGTAELTGRVINLGQEHVNKLNFLRAHGLYAAAKGMLAHYGGPFSKVVNHSAVRKHLDIIQKLDPDSPVVTFGLGSYQMLIPPILGRDLDKARIYLEKTIAAEPLFPDPYVRLAQIYRLKGDMEKYRELIAKALELDPKNELAVDIQQRTCKFICLKGTE